MRKTYLHPLPLRLWHWSNAIIVILLLITGAQLRLHGVPELPRHSLALIIHRYAGWAMVASFILWLIYCLATRHLGRHYKLRRSDAKGITRQTTFYVWSIFKGDENPHRVSPDDKFNPLQKIANSAIMGIVTPVLVITGLLFSDIQLVRNYILQWNMVKLLNIIHVLGAYLFALYLIVHIYMSTLGRKLSYIRAMISGYGEEPDDSGRNDVQQSVAGR